MQRVKASLLTFPGWGWHYSNLEDDAKLRASLKQFGQLVPIIVRDVDGHYEVIDGRRRLQLLKNLVEDVWILNTGALTEPDAIRLGLTLELTATVDYPRLAEQVKRVYSPTLANITPFTDERLQYFVALCGFDWEQYRSSV